MMEINPCPICGNKNIILDHCGYSSFNPASATCPDCKTNFKLGYVDWDCSKTGLARMLNNKYPIVERSTDSYVSLDWKYHDPKEMILVLVVIKTDFTFHPYEFVTGYLNHDKCWKTINDETIENVVGWTELPRFIEEVKNEPTIDPELVEAYEDIKKYGFVGTIEDYIRYCEERRDKVFKANSEQF
jgi:hypothetical protein